MIELVGEMRCCIGRADTDARVVLVDCVPIHSITLVGGLHRWARVRLNIGWGFNRITFDQCENRVGQELTDAESVRHYIGQCSANIKSDKDYIGHISPMKRQNA